MLTDIDSLSFDLLYCVCLQPDLVFDMVGPEAS